MSEDNPNNDKTTINAREDGNKMVLTVIEMILKNRAQIKGIDIDVDDQDPNKDPTLKIVCIYDREKF